MQLLEWIGHKLDTTMGWLWHLHPGWVIVAGALMVGAVVMLMRPR